MPEGDTVYKLAAALLPDLRGATVLAVRLQRLCAERLVGRSILGVASKGKHLYIDFDNGLVLRSHLGMFGSWHRYSPGERWHKPAWQASIVLETGKCVCVCFNAKEVEILAAGGFRLADGQRRLGPDLIRERPRGLLLVQRARELLGPDTPLADLLLDQRVAAGIGNIYKCEVLFLERQSPLRPLGDTSEQVLVGLYDRAAELLRGNLHQGRRVTRFVGDGRGDLWVYGRVGQACLRCGDPVRRAQLGLNPRPTYWCALCQEGKPGY